MSSLRVGWVPTEQEYMPVKSAYDWVDGLSVTEMEVVHGAIRCKNPNALFLRRHQSFLDNVPDQSKGIFLDKDPNALMKTEMFHKQISSLFPNQCITYYAKYNQNEDKNVLTGFEELLADKILEFFKKRISEQYPVDSAQLPIFEEVANHHNALLRYEVAQLGTLPLWDSQLKVIMNYLKNENVKTPCVIQAPAGAGKSSASAALVHKVRTESPNIRTFVHFTGSLPGSTRMQYLLKRLGNFLSVDNLDQTHDLPQKILKAFEETTEKILIVIDGYGRLDNPIASWIPYPLKSTVKIVLTLRSNSEFFQHFDDLYPGDLVALFLHPFDYELRKEVVRTFLKQYNKALDESQMKLLLDKKGSTNYYWLSLVCEELRIFGQFEQVTNKIKSFPDSVIDLEEDVINRIIGENEYADLVIATLCFLVAANERLYENELTSLLAEPPNLLPPQLRTDEIYRNTLHPHKWAVVLRDVRKWIRPFGSAADGRLSISKHDTFRKTVEQRFFQPHAESISNWFHGKLAIFFEKHKILERQITEYPFHLSVIQDFEKLKKYLTRFEVILYFLKNSKLPSLKTLWYQVDPTYNTMVELYLKKVDEILADESIDCDKSCYMAYKISFVCYVAAKYDDVLTIYRKVFEKYTSEEIEDEIEAKLIYSRTRAEEKSLLFGKSGIDREQVIMTLERALEFILPKSNEFRSLRKYVAKIKNRCATLKLKEYFELVASSPEAQALRSSASEDSKMAMDIFNYEIQDPISYANTMTTMALCQESIKERMEWFKKAEDILGTNASTFTDVNARLYHNMAITYEKSGQLQKAFEYHQKCAHTSQVIYGSSHPETLHYQSFVQKIKTTLNEVSTTS